MKIFRHAPLTFWSAVLLSMLLLVGAARCTGGELPAPQFGVRSDLVSEYRAQASDLTLQVQSGLANLSWVRTWSAKASSTAQRAKGSSSTKMSAGWIEAELAALEVAKLTELDSQAAVRAIKRVNDAADSLAGLASGISSQPTR